MKTRLMSAKKAYIGRDPSGEAIYIAEMVDSEAKRYVPIQEVPHWTSSWDLEEGRV